MWVFANVPLYGIDYFLRQAWYAESKDPDEPEEMGRDQHPDAPGPVKKGGWRLAVYKHSLSIAFAILFLLSWIMHLYGSFRDANHENSIKGQPVVQLNDYLGEPLFWFETFQNWQSEFLSVASIVLLSIFLRQKGSPESKPVDAAHGETGK